MGCGASSAAAGQAHAPTGAGPAPSSSERAASGSRDPTRAGAVGSGSEGSNAATAAAPAPGSRPVSGAAPSASGTAGPTAAAATDTDPLSTSRQASASVRTASRSGSESARRPPSGPGSSGTATGANPARQASRSSSRPASAQPPQPHDQGSEPPADHAVLQAVPQPGDELHAAGAPPEPSPAAEKLAPAAEPDDPLATTRLGISLRGLRHVVALLRQRFGDAAFEAMSTDDVKTAWVLPETAAKRCRLLEAGVLDAEDVGPPDYFISHAWRNRACRLLDYVLAYLQNADDARTRVWIDIFAVNQHGESPQNAADVAAFQHVVAACAAGTVVVLDQECVSPATRAWCVFEWTHTLALHGPDGLHLRLQPGERAAIVANINVEQAGCFKAEDKEMIMAEVRAHHESAERFDAKLKLQLVLEPLSEWDSKVRATEWTFVGCAGAQRRWARGGSCTTLRRGSRRTAAAAAAAARACCAWPLARARASPPSRRTCAATPPSAPTTFASTMTNGGRIRFAPVRELLLQQDVAKVARLQDVEAAFALLLLQPLEALAAAEPQQQRQVVILIDALDEADPVELQAEGGQAACPRVCGNKALQILTTQLPRLPPCARFVATTRPDAAAGQVLPCLQRTFPDSLLSLAPSAFRALPAAAPDAAAASVPGVDGVMVFHTAVLALEGEAAGGGAGATGAPVVAAARPASPTLDDVYGVYGAVFDAARSREAATAPDRLARVLELADVLMAAQEPLSQSLLQQLQLADAVARLPGFPVLFFADEHHVYTAHKSLADWLLDASRSGPHSASRARGHARIGLHLARTWQQQQAAQQQQLQQQQQQQQPDDSGSSGGGGSSTASAHMPYLLKYTVPHLAAAAAAAGAAGSPDECAEAARALDTLLTTPRFIQDLLAAGTAAAAMAALSTMQQPTRFSSDVVRWLRQHMLNLQGKPTSDIAHSALFTAPLKSALFEHAREGYGFPWHPAGTLPRGVTDEWPASAAVLKAPSVVNWLSYSPDGTQLASCGGSKEAYVWSTATGELIATLAGSTTFVERVVFSPGGSQIATADSVLRMWDAATGQCVAQHEAPGRVSCVAWSVDGRVLAFSYLRGIGVVDASAQQLISSIDLEFDANAMALSPDATQLATCANYSVFFWDAATGKRIGHSHGHSDRALCLAYSPDGRLVASGAADRTVRLIDAATHECVATLRDPRAQVRGVAFSPDGRFLAAASGDSKVRVWDVASRQCLAAFSGHTGDAYCVAFAPNSMQLASGGGDRAIILWDLARLAGGAGSGGGAAAEPAAHTAAVQCVAFSPDGQRVASGGHDCTVRLWDAATCECAATVDSGALVDGVCYSPDGALLATCSASGEAVRVWDAATGAPAWSFAMPRNLGGAFCVAFSPDGAQLAVGCMRKVLLLDAKSRRVRSTLQGHHELGVCAAAFCPAGRSLLVSADYAGGVRVWDPASGRAAGSLAHGGSSPVCLCFSHDGSTLASADGERNTSGGGQSVILWSVADWQRIRVIQVDMGWASLCFSHDGTLLIGGGKAIWNGTVHSVHVWDVASGECVARMPGHTDGVTGVCFSPDGRLVVSSSKDRTLRLWRRRSAGDA